MSPHTHWRTPRGVVTAGPGTGGGGGGPGRSRGAPRPSRPRTAPGTAGSRELRQRVRLRRRLWALGLGALPPLFAPRRPAELSLAALLHGPSPVFAVLAPRASNAKLPSFLRCCTKKRLVLSSLLAKHLLLLAWNAFANALFCQQPRGCELGVQVAGGCRAYCGETELPLLVFHLSVPLCQQFVSCYLLLLPQGEGSVI